MKDVMEADEQLVSWVMRLRAEFETEELRAQVGSFCAFVDKCPFFSHTECSKCLDYYLRVESTSKVYAR